jgi:plastocyanin
MNEPNKPANVFPILIVVAVAAGLLFIAIGKVDRGDSTEVNVNVSVAVEPSSATDSIPTTLPPDPPITSPPVTAPDSTSPSARTGEAASGGNIRDSGSKPSPTRESSSTKSRIGARTVSVPSVTVSGPSVTISVADTPNKWISGRITLLGTPPKEVNLPLDPACGIAYRKLNATGKPTTRFYVVGTNSGLADVFVTLVNVKGKYSTDGLDPITIDQRGCEFLPYVSACLAGQTIRFLNSDPVLHNVHPQPQIRSNPESNRAHLPNSPPLNFVYTAPEEFLKFKCDVHPWMYSYVNIVAHPYFAVSGANGHFEIENPPAGKYVLRVHHRKLGLLEREIEILATGGVQADFEFKIEE